MAAQLTSPGQSPSGTPTDKSKSSQDAVERWLQHKRNRRTGTLLCVGVAAVFVLFCFVLLITGAKPEPTKTELMPVSTTGTTSGTIQTSTPTPPTGQTSAPGTSTSSNNVSMKESGRFISTSSWEHVIHTGILFVSCVAMFAILARAAVALNREDD